MALHDGLFDRGLDGLDDEGAGFGAGDALFFFEVLEERLDVLAHLGGRAGVDGVRVEKFRGQKRRVRVGPTFF